MSAPVESTALATVPQTSAGYSDVCSAAAEVDAASRGCVVVKPGPRDLFIDIDSAEQFAKFKTAWRVFEKMHPLAVIAREAPSPSAKPGHWHIYVTMCEDVDAITRILYQACLASDPVREALSLLRLHRGDDTPTLFFEKRPT